MPKATQQALNQCLVNQECNGCVQGTPWLQIIHVKQKFIVSLSKDMMHHCDKYFGTQALTDHVLCIAVSFCHIVIENVITDEAFEQNYLMAAGDSRDRVCFQLTVYFF